MRIEAGIHPAAPYVSVYLRGVRLDHVVWVDVARFEACIHRTDQHGNILHVGDYFVNHIISGPFAIGIDPEHAHLLEAK